MHHLLEHIGPRPSVLMAFKVQSFHRYWCTNFSFQNLL